MRGPGPHSFWLGVMWGRGVVCGVQAGWQGWCSHTCPPPPQEQEVALRLFPGSRKAPRCVCVTAPENGQVQPFLVRGAEGSMPAVTP